MSNPYPATFEDSNGTIERLTSFVANFDGASARNFAISSAVLVKL